MALPLEVTDPGSVNAADQGFGVGIAADVTPGETVANSQPGVGVASVVRGDASLGNGRGAATDVNQGDAVANQGNAGLGIRPTIDGGSGLPLVGITVDVNAGDAVANQGNAGTGIRPTVSGDATPAPPGNARSPTANVIENDVVNQIYGNGRLPTNVNV